MASNVNSENAEQERIQRQEDKSQKGCVLIFLNCCLQDSKLCYTLHWSDHQMQTANLRVLQCGRQPAEDHRGTRLAELQ